MIPKKHKVYIKRRKNYPNGESVFFYMGETFDGHKYHGHNYNMPDNTVDKYIDHMSYYSDWYSGSIHDTENEDDKFFDDFEELSLNEFFKGREHLIYPTIKNLAIDKFYTQKGFKEMRLETLAYVKKISENFGDYPNSYLIEAEDLGLL